VDWIRLAQDRNWWRAVVSAVMNLRVLATRSYTTTARILCTGRPVTLLFSNRHV
jgi:hypothetical protein